MPFTKLADIKTAEKYKSLLKAELGKLSEQRVKFLYFEKVKLEGGSKEGDPFVLLGTFPPAIVDELKKAGEYKARGAIGEAADKSVEYTVQHGTLKAPVLKKALAEVKNVLVNEVDPAQGEVVESQGGREPKPDADRQAEALQAQYEKLRAGYGKVASAMAEMTKRGLRDLFAAADTALQDKEWATAGKHLTTITMQMTAYARDRQLAAKSTEAPLEKAAAVAVPELERVGQAQTSVTDLPAKIKDAEALVRGAQTDLDNARDAGLKGQKPQVSVKDASAKLAEAKLKVEDLKKVLGAAKLELAKNPKLAQELVTRWQELSKKIEAADKESKSLLDKMGLGVPTPGKIDKAPGLKEAQDALAGKMPGVADSKKKLVEFIDKHAQEATNLRTRHTALAKDVLALTGQPLADSAIVPFEQKVAALQKRLETGPDPRDMTRDAELSNLSADADAWLKQRTDNVAEVNKLGIADKVRIHLATKWGATDAAMKEAKSKLDAALAGALAVNAGTLNPLLKKLGTAGTPSWNGEWTKGREATLKQLTGREAPFDDMAAWAREVFSRERDEVQGTDFKKGLQKVDGLVLAELKKRMKQLIADVGATFVDLQAQTRLAVSNDLNKLVNQMSKLGDATGVLADFRYRSAWDFEDKLAQQFQAQHNAQELARRPTRAQWAAHMGIAENHYIVQQTPQTFELNGVLHRTHFTVSYDSVTAARPHIHGLNVQSVLNAAFINSVPTVLQAHATIEMDGENPHLYLTGDIHPKALVGDDKERARQVLMQVRVALLAWLNQKITSFQQTIH